MSTYPKNFKIKSKEEQIESWKKILDLNKSTNLPDGAEGIGVIPKPSIFGSYCDALNFMLDLLEKSRPFTNWRKRELTDKHVQLTDKTKSWLDKLEKETEDDFLAFPFQFGLKHAGKSVNRSRAAFTANEVGLGPYEVAALLLANPNRLQAYEDLGIDCAGADYTPSGSGSFGSYLYFSWFVGKLGFDYCDLGSPSESFGSASAFGGASA